MPPLSKTDPCSIPVSANASLFARWYQCVETERGTRVFDGNWGNSFVSEEFYWRKERHCKDHAEIDQQTGDLATTGKGRPGPGKGRARKGVGQGDIVASHCKRADLLSILALPFLVLCLFLQSSPVTAYMENGATQNNASPTVFSV